ncbi:MAG: sulfurtransferase [Xanthomonadaceae bacterium]|nr:sulfurtransferase [Xanthomonadaceae bacterium]MDP2184482.1 sulfurtransferase [Xanthomonadales bacterium]MDZ4115398.1 sulfurtransferase [Xanthomonadaceae bacterium]MDZ4379556.1 sulfurtransferase [Xanthomonadaceae bacterium]
MKTCDGLIQAEELLPLLGRADLVVVDCRFDLTDPHAGEQAWLSAHIAGARYADLDRDLSDHSQAGHGRHPLPRANALCQRLVAWGISPTHQVVAYDAGDGAMAAARLWAMLRLLGHRRVAVLDGGLRRWQALGLAVDNRTVSARPTQYEATFDSTAVISTAQVLARLREQPAWLIDARAGARFRGEVEPIDAVAGHVPGAINRPYSDNLAADGRFLAADILRAQFRALLGDRNEDVAVMCGSGVTACHHLLAMHVAGISGVQLYADSWSGWISDSTRPMATS